jgi:hypothetical protein
VPHPNLPVFNPSGGTYTNAQPVTITSAGATSIYYTTDGVTINPYTAPVTIASNTALQAFSVNKAGASPVASANFIINP